MRIHFANQERFLKAAQKTSKLSNQPLAKVQDVLARVCGYQDLFDFQKNYATGPATRLDQELEPDEFVTRQCELSLSLAERLDVSEGDAQFFLGRSHLTGDRQTSLEEQIAIRLLCFEKREFPIAAKRTMGAIGRLKSPGRNGEIVILKSYGRPCDVVTNTNVGTVADFEYISPKTPPRLFIPLRLYLPYGLWTEEDGAKVLFSRDYFPLWRVREGSTPERLEPWLRINYVEQKWFWDDGEVPWQSRSTKARVEKVLSDWRVNALPMWVEALPLIVRDANIDTFRDALGPFRLLRQKPLAEAAE
ncbi:MAG TPA: hypothetical protein VGH02_01475 [Rhizomicrobium sp.]